MGITLECGAVYQRVDDPALKYCPDCSEADPDHEFEECDPGDIADVLYAELEEHGGYTATMYCEACAIPIAIV